MILPQSYPTVNSKNVQLYTLPDSQRQIRDKIRDMTKELEVDGKRLELLLTQRKWKPSTLAYKSGVSKAMILQIIKGGRPNASAVLVGRLAYELQCSVDYLVGLTENPLPYGLQGTDEEAQRMMAALATLTPARRHELLRIAEMLRQVEEDEQRALVQDLRAMDALLGMISDTWGADKLKQLLDALGKPAGLSGDDILGWLDESDDTDIPDNDEFSDDEGESDE